MYRILAATFLSGMLLAPVATHLAAADQKDHRYYDASHKDYHEWNDNEDRAYRHWLDEHHRPYHAWTKASKKEQAEYWRWRHDHMDWHE